jgi:dipeptidyl aminopeptidase/acylaminoacyl peptidase
MRLQTCLALIISLLLPPMSPGQPAKLTIETVMKGPQYAGYAPQSLRWSGDSQKVYFQWKRHTDSPRAPYDTYVVNRDGSGLLKLNEEEARLAPPIACEYDARRERCVHTVSGDVWLYDFRSDKALRLTLTSDVETQPRFLPAGDRIAYQRNNNLILHSLINGTVEQVTDIRTGKPSPDEDEPQPDPKKELTAQEFLKQEELKLLNAVRERSERKKETRDRRLQLDPRKPHYLGARETVSSLRLIAGEYVVATITERAEGAKPSIVPNYVTESAYTEDIAARGNVGDRQSRSTLHVIHARTGAIKAVDYDLGDKGKTVTVFNVAVSDDGKNFAFLLRGQDNKDLYRMALDPASAKAKTLVHDHDDAWIGGPAVYHLSFGADDSTLYFQSEKSGYSHVYRVPFSGGEAQALTRGRWEVTSLRWSRDRRLLFLTTSELSPHERHFYSLDPNSGVKVKLTTTAGDHAATPSPNEKWLAEISSFTNKPDEVFVSELKPNAPTIKLTNSPSPAFLARKWLEPALVEIPARDGVKVPGHLIKPASARRGGPAVIFVHGAGYLQNIHKGWSNYFREYMFHHILAEAGYTVLDIDYRASAGYGRDWRTGIYRFMGGKDLEDHLDAAKWLVAAHGINPKKIGIYGGSYGGFMTLMALFTSPDTFAAGAALRPVTDWAHYNHGYTSNILNEPHKDPEAYRKSSPIYHAQGLKSALLICHGMVDVNVHYQDSVRLAQRLMELGKENWELASYPVEDHGFVDAASWTDEYKRIFKLFEKHLK